MPAAILNPPLSSRPVPGLLLAAALLTVWLGWWLVTSESTAYRARGDTSIQRIAAIATADIGIPVTSPESTRLLLDCLAVAERRQSLTMRFQPPEMQDAIHQTCHDLAQTLSLRRPTSALVWFARASLAASDKDWDTFTLALGHSYETGASVQWIAERRAALAEDNLARLDTDLLERHHDDLELLVRSPRGIATIARRYLTNPEFRERIAAIVETLPDQTQIDFLRMIRLQAANTRLR